MPSPVLRIQLLGGFRLTYGGHAIETLSSPRLQSLLAYLVLHRDTPPSRQHLAFCLWPDSSPSQALSNLRYLLHALRQALPAPDRYLRSDTLTIQWRTDAPFDLDVLDFENAVAQAASTLAWQHAVELYRGDLLPSSYEDWVLLERDRLCKEFIVALEQLCDGLEAEGNYASAIRDAQRLLHCEPLREEIYSRLMRLHALNGDRAGVVRVYNTCVTVLERELAIAPSPDTQQTYEECLQAHVSSAPPPLAPPPVAPARSNLPHALTNFIGREREVAELQQRVGAHRLVTLTGAGGIGKSRLALAVGEGLVERYCDGVWWVDLAPLAAPDLVERELAATLRVREEAGRPLAESLEEYLRNKSLVLVLDNCEHVIEPVGRLAERLLRAAAKLHILATSRESLRLAGEAVWSVPSLSLPAEWPSGSEREEHPSSALLECESGRLFLDRAIVTLPTFAVTDDNAPAIARICSRVDGIPLAIEFAAARVRLLSVEQIAERLNDSLRLLTDGTRTALPRHRTLRATMDWSYRLLTGNEQTLLRELSVFAGGFTLEAAEFVCGETEPPQSDRPRSGESEEVLDLVSSLTDKSLVMADPSSQARFRLHEITRQYAGIKLAEAKAETRIRERHLDYFCQFAEVMEASTRGPNYGNAVACLTREYGNLRQALDWSANGAGDAEKGLRLAASLDRFWEHQGLLGEGHGWLVKLLARTGAAPPELRAKALEAAGKAAYFVCDPAASRSFYSASLELYRQLNNQAGVAWTLSRVGYILATERDFAAAIPLVQESITMYRTLGDGVNLAEELCVLAFIYMRQGEPARARSLLEESLTAMEGQNSEYQEARCRWTLGHVAAAERKYAEARSLYARAITLLQKMGHLWGVMYLLDSFGRLALAENLCGRAVGLFAAAEQLGANLGTALAPIEKVEHDRGVVAARAALGETAFQVAWARGEAMTPEQAIAYALEDGVK